MFFKGVIFDLDDTLCNYQESHEFAINKICNEISCEFKVDLNQVIQLLDIVKKKFKIEAGNTASSHNRFIYLKHLFESLNINLKYVEKYNNLYWSSFNEKCELIEGSYELLNFLKSKLIKLTLLTDFCTHEQLSKINVLNILDFFDFIITSEEIGIEKPSSRMFTYAVNKMNLKNSEVIMIGNDIKKDIDGAIYNNIYPFYLCSSDLMINNQLTVFKNFHQLNTFFYEIDTYLKEFKNICKYTGERYDLVQAGGGNISFKYRNLIFIKSSGYCLSDINMFEGYTVIDLNKLEVIFGKKPSMEYLMHCKLKKWVIHLHPIQINKLLCNQEGKYFLNTLFPNSLIIDYVTPGKELFYQINKEYIDQEIIFLKNHGIIITGEYIDKIYILLEDVLNKVETVLNLDYQLYKNCNIISKLINEQFLDDEIITYKSDDLLINKILVSNPEYFNIPPLFPDYVVYCGEKILNLQKFDLEFKPTVIIYNNSLYISSKSLVKCREIEMVLKSHLECITNKPVCLTKENIEKLLNMDEEKYRKNL